MRQVRIVSISRSSGVLNRNRKLLIGAGSTIVLLIMVIAYFYSGILSSNQGNFVYGLDDPYIHLSIARNFVEHGVWGLNPATPTSSSSSPLWTMLLALIYASTGMLDIVPLILNMLFSFVVVLLLFLIISKFFVNPLVTTIWVNTVIYGTYLPRMVFMGMEHVLHVLLLLIIIKKLIDNYQENLRLGFSFWVTISLALATRYETILIVSILSIFFWMMRDTKYFWYALISAFISLSLTGLLSVLADGWILPNSVFLRRTVFQISYKTPLTLLNNFYLTLQSQYQFPLILTMLSAIISLLKSMNDSMQKTFLLLFLISSGTAILHSMIGMMVLRYFFYINILLIIALIYGFYFIKKQKYVDFALSKDFLGLTKASIFVIFCIGLIWNGMMANRKTVQASVNIYEQQIQTAAFVKDYYNSSTIVLNDIGAISRYSNAQFVDIAGLADNQIAELIHRNTLTSNNLSDRLRTSNIDIIILPEVVLNTLNPNELKWINVGSWKIMRNVVCASETVHFLAPDTAKAKKLAENLRKFNYHLPRSVLVKLDGGF